MCLLPRLGPLSHANGNLQHSINQSLTASMRQGGIATSLNWTKKLFRPVGVNQVVRASDEPRRTLAVKLDSSSTVRGGEKGCQFRRSWTEPMEPVFGPFGVPIKHNPAAVRGGGPDR
jgi:hypothetical protein